jgi:hypothetical protein
MIEKIKIFLKNILKNIEEAGIARARQRIEIYKFRSWE